MHFKIQSVYCLDLLTVFDLGLLVRHDVVAEDLLEESLLHAGVEEALGGVQTVDVRVTVVLKLHETTEMSISEWPSFHHPQNCSNIIICQLAYFSSPT